MQVDISASILSADFARLGEECRAVVAAGATSIHFDVMDHHFVPNLSFGAVVCQALRDAGITVPIHVHLMVDQPEAYVEPFAKAGASLLCFHPETAQDIDQLIDEIHAKNMQAGIALNPDVELSLSKHQLDRINMLLLMSVYPGFGGQVFIPETLEKIARMRELLGEENPSCLLAVDGGVNQETIRKVVKAGAECLVVGSGLFSANDYAERITALQQACL